MDGIETLPYDENRLNVGIECQTCGTIMSLHRGRFPICDDCLKVLREIIKERNSVKKFVEKALSKKTTVYYGLNTPKWIREKIDAQAGDTVSVMILQNGFIKEKYGYVNRKRVHHGDKLYFDGENWVNLDIGKIDPLYGILMSSKKRKKK